MVTKRVLLDLYSELKDYCSELEARIYALENKQPRTKDGKFAKKK